MRLAALITASAAALTLAGCQNNTDKAAEDAAAADATPMEAQSAPTDAAAASGPASPSPSTSTSGSTSAARSRETLSPPRTASVSSDGMTVATAEQPAAAGANQTDTERRLNPAQTTAPAQ